MLRNSYSRVPSAPLSQSYLLSGPVGATCGSYRNGKPGLTAWSRPSQTTGSVMFANVLISASGRVSCC